LIDDAAAELSKDFVNEDFNFNQRVLRGTKEIKPRWRRVITSTDGAMGEALGKLYVADYFPPEAKARALEMINNLKAALADRIRTLDWMDEPTKQEALKKLAATIQVIERFGTISQRDNFVRQAVSLERGEGQFGITRAVIHEQDALAGAGHGR